MRFDFGIWRRLGDYLCYVKRERMHKYRAFCFSKRGCIELLENKEVLSASASGVFSAVNVGDEVYCCQQDVIQNEIIDVVLSDDTESQLVDNTQKCGILASLDNFWGAFTEKSNVSEFAYNSVNGSEDVDLSFVENEDFLSENDGSSVDSLSSSGGSVGGSGGTSFSAYISGGAVNSLSGGMVFDTDHVIKEGGSFSIVYYGVESGWSVSCSLTGGTDDFETMVSSTGGFTFTSIADGLYEGNEVFTATVTATAPSGAVSSVVFTITVYDSPEFISDCDANLLALNSEYDNHTVNSDYANVYLTTSSLVSDVVVYTPSIHSANPVTYTLSSAGNVLSERSIIYVESSTGKIHYNPTLQSDSTLGYGSAVLTLKASYGDGSSDDLLINIRWADVSVAKLVVANCRETTYNNGSYSIGTETCQRFAEDFDSALSTLRATDGNLNCAIRQANIVVYSLPLSYWPSTRHAVVRVEYIDGSVIYYDNGAWGGVFTTIPGYAEEL